MYLRTTKAIADYVGREYGRKMRMLVKNGNEETFTEPKPPKSKEDLSPGVLEKFKTELTIYHKDLKEYKDQKAKVFVIILGQCSQVVKSKLESDKEFTTLKKKDDVVGLLGKLKEMAYLTGGVQDLYWTLQRVLKHLTTINQPPTEG